MCDSIKKAKMSLEIIAKKKACKAGCELGLWFPDWAASNSQSDIVLNTDLVESLCDVAVIWLTGLQISAIKTKTFRPPQRFGRWVYPDIMSIVRFLFRLFLHQKTLLKSKELILT